MDNNEQNELDELKEETLANFRHVHERLDALEKLEVAINGDTAGKQHSIRDSIANLWEKVRAIEASLHGEDHDQRARWEELDARSETPKDVERPSGEPTGLIHDVTEMALLVGNLTADLGKSHELVSVVRKLEAKVNVLGAGKDWATRVQLDEAIGKHAKAMSQRIADVSADVRDKLKGISADDLATAVRWAAKYKREVEIRLAMPSRFEALVFGLTGRNGRR
jgi:hypothetical protein